MAIAKVAKKTTESLDHLIPDKATYLDPYISRLIGGVQDLKMLQTARQNHDNVMLYGPTGPGKTALVMAFGAWKQRPVVTIQCHGAVDPSSFWGQMVYDADSDRYKWSYSDIAKVVMSGGVLYIDEMNFLPPKVGASLHSLLDGRRFVTIMENGNELVESNPDLLIVATFNPEYEGTRPLNFATKNRFAMKLEWDYNTEIESELVGVPSLQELAQRVRAMHAQGDLDAPVTTRDMMTFVRFALDPALGWEFATSNFIGGFDKSDQEVVKNVFELFSERIKTELDEASQ